MKEYRKIIKIGNSLGVTLPKKGYSFRDLEAGDWIEITIKKMKQ